MDRAFFILPDIVWWDCQGADCAVQPDPNQAPDLIINHGEAGPWGFRPAEQTSRPGEPPGRAGLLDPHR